MTMTIGARKKQALKQLRAAGKDFVTDFLSAYPGAVPLRSKDPGLCWKASGQVAYATIFEYAGPNSTEEEAPVLLRLRTNMYPPPAIYYHLRSPKVRHKLGVSINPLLAEDPVLEITGLPEEVGQLGRWLTSWLDSYFYQRNLVPPPPVKLLSWRVDQNLVESRKDLVSLKDDWRNHLYIWTPAAIKTWQDYISK